MGNKLYIDLLKKVLVDFHRSEKGEYRPLLRSNANWVIRLIDKLLRRNKYAIRRFIKYNQAERNEGKDRPSQADTMIGLKRLDNIEYCFNEVIKNNIPGDFIETGVWRGGAVILMKALLKASNVNDRVVWVADSFEGLPEPNAKAYLADEGDLHYEDEELAVPLEIVKNNFSKYDLLDDNVKFLKGWFKDTLPSAPIKQLSILRLDGDMYESTMDTLVNLYPKLSKGGFIIIDDWGAIKACKQAVNDYRKKHSITEEIMAIDWTGVYWRKEN